MAIYTYSISSDVTAGTVYSDGIHAEISGSAIVATFVGITIEGDVLSIDFSSILSVFQEAVLDLLVQNHPGIVPPSSPDSTDLSFNPTGNISSTTIQSAIEELDSEKLPTTTTVSSLGGDVAGSPRPPNGPASGQLGGTYPSPDVRGIRTTSGPTLLTIGAIADRQIPRRIGSSLVGVSNFMEFIGFAVDESVSITTSTTNQVKLTYNAGTISSGTYMILVTYGWNHDATNNGFEGYVELNNGSGFSQIGEHHQQEPQDSNGTFGSTGTDQRHYLTRFFVRSLVSAPTSIRVLYRTNSGGVRSSIWDTYIALIKVG